MTTDRGGWVAASVALVVATAGIGWIQPALAAQTRKVHLIDDVSAIPPPDELRAMSFGYRAAVADVVWAGLLVQVGVRTQEKRSFNDVNRYIDGLIALDPKHPSIYRFADTLVLYKPVGISGETEARDARRYLERGTKELPYDSEMWLHYGQFLAFMAPSFLTDPQEIDAWRREGAYAISRAVDLGADADRSLSASTILSKAGETDAAIRQLQRAYAITDSHETRLQILAKLQRLRADLGVEVSVDIVERTWRDRFRWTSLSGALLLGPPREAALCAGIDSRLDPRCPADWTAATAH